MRHLITIAFTFISIGVNAQDYCKDIVFTQKELSGEKHWRSPMKLNSPQVIISKDITKDGEIFQVDFVTQSPVSQRGEKGIYVKFEDGSIFKLEDAKLTNDYSVYGSTYLAVATVELTEENLKLFSTKKIVKYQVGSIEKEFPKKWQDKYMGYFKCMSDKE